MTDLISSTTRSLFQDALAGHSTNSKISSAFTAENFPSSPDNSWDQQGPQSRRVTADLHMRLIDWTNEDQVRRFFRVVERLGYEFPSSSIVAIQFWHSLDRDGYERNEDTGHLRPKGLQIAITSLSALKDPSAVAEQWARLRRAADSEDPALTVGSARELVESTAKAVLQHFNVAFAEHDKLPKLTHAAAAELGLGTGQGLDGSDQIKRILGAVSVIPTALNELRNQGYGTGHGPATARVGVRPRHARLAVNAAITWCQLVLDTLADPDAPWRTSGTPKP